MGTNKQEDTPRARILIVDDDPGNLAALSLVLQPHYDVLAAPSGKRALEIAARTPKPDLILLDVMMPGMDGSEVCCRLKADARSRDIPVLFISVLAETTDKIKGFEAGGLDYIVKPFMAEEVLARVKLHLRMHELTEHLEQTVHERTGELRAVNLSLQQEINEHKKAEEALRESEGRFRGLLESVTSYMYTVVMDGGRAVSTTHGPGCFGVTGFSVEDYAADSDLWHRMIHPEDRQTVFDVVQKVLTSQNTNTLEHRIQHKDGSIRWVRTTFVPHVSPEGQLLSYDGMLTDITERKGLESQLRQAQKMEAIGTLAGGIAHDFNNILTPILGYSELVAERLPTRSEEQKLVQEIFKAGKRAKELVKQILTFSRQTEQERQPVMIHLIVKEALKLLRSSIPTTIAIKQNVVDCGLVMADPTQIHQILMNLCTNAYHAMREAGGELGVSLSVVEITAQDYLDNLALQPGPHVKLSVKDTGGGMSKVLQERIFDPYFTTKEVGEGTGLGLSVVLGIVLSHQGHITVYSEPGQGTEFHVYLPQVKGLGEGLAEESGAVAIPRGSGTILVVDDDVTVGQMLRAILRSLGYEVVLCSSSTEALERFIQNRERIALVLTDMAMPVMNGTELTRRIKQLSPATPVVLCTGFSDIMDEEKARRMGIDGYLLKPVIKSQLAQTIHEVLKKKDESGSAP